MTNQEPNSLIAKLLRVAKLREQNSASCVIESSNGEILTLHERGVSDLYRLLTQDSEALNGSLIADKVVGKGAAALMILGKVRALYAVVISKPALELLNAHTIEVHYNQIVENIINRTATDICPIERRCLKCLTPEECLKEIEDFLNTRHS